MAETTNPPQPVSAPCECILFRAARSNSQVDRDNQKLFPTAYERRISDDDGLSFGVAGAYESASEYARPEHCGLTAHGVASHHTGHTRELRYGDIRLDVVLDSPSHALVTTMPFGSLSLNTEGFSLEAYHLAVLLADQSRLVWDRKRSQQPGS